MKNVKAIIFDAYGTLFDVNSAAEKCKDKIGSKWEPFANFWRTTQLEYTWLRSLMERHKDFWLAFSPIKSNYQNFMIQKATELGVTKFLPIIFDRTVVRKINNERLEKIVIEASEQSNRLNVPEIEKAQDLKNFLNSNSMDLIFTDLNSDNKKIEKSKLTDKPICIIIGPEGDFSEAEREEILSFKGVQSLKINENILRSETAVISAISIINYVIN